VNIGFDPLYPLRAARRYAWPEDRARGWAFAALLALGLLLRLLFVGEPIRWDEAANAVYYTSNDLLYAIGGSGGNPNHVLHSLLSWFSVRVMGWSIVSFRAPVLVAGILAVWAVYAAARWTFGREREAVLAAALAAVSPLWVHYSVNGRGYIYQAALVPLIFVLVARGLRGGLPVRQARSCALWAAALTVLGAAAVRSMLVFFVPLAVLSVAGWALRRRRGSGEAGPGAFVTTWLGAVGALAALAFLPVWLTRGTSGVVGIASRFGAPWSVIAPRTGAYWIELVREELFRGPGTSAVVASVALIALGLVAAVREHRELAFFAVLLVACSFPVAAFAHIWLPIRVLAPAGFVFFLLWARGAGVLADRVARSGPRRAALVTALAGAAAVGLPLSTLGGSPGFVPMDHHHVREGATRLFGLGDLSRSALVVPATWDDAPVAFYALAAGMEIPYLVGMDRVERERNPCDLDELVVVSDAGPAAVALDSPFYRRAVGEPLRRVPLDGLGVEVGRWRLAPCTAGSSR